ncbi:MAG: peptidoglycan-binding protein, partial [Bradymonadaceae bacterium]
MMNTKHLIFGLLAILLPIATACDDGTITDKKARTYVDKWAKQAEKSLDEHVPADDATERFETVVKEAARADEDSVSRTEPPYDVFIRDVYADLGWSLRLAGDDGLTDRGKSIWKVLRRADTHSLELKSFEFDAIKKHLKQVQSLDKEVAKLDSYSLSDRERSAAVDWLTRQKRADFELTPENFDRLVEAVVDSEAGDGLAEHMKELERVYGQRADAVAGLEHLVARNAVRYSRKMKHFRLRHLYVHPREDDYWSNPVIQDQNPHAERPDKAEASYVAGQVWREAAKTADEMKQPVKILHDRMRATLREVLAADDPAAVLEDLEPDHPQYAKLQKEYDRYRKIVENGGWEKVEPDRYLDRGESDPIVADLKKRLQIEDYYPDDADLDETFDETLEKAIEQYQTTHQMRVTG